MQAIYPGIYETENLRLAFRKVKKNKGIAGIDGVSIDFFSLFLEENLSRIKRELEEDIYRPGPLLRLNISRNGKDRALSIPTVRDRIVQYALLNKLTPLIDPEFKPSSFAYRRGRSVDDAISTMKEYATKGYRWVLRSDISSFFDSIEHDILLRKVTKMIGEERIVKLIDNWLNQEVYDGGDVLRLDRFHKAHPFHPFWLIYI